VRGDSTGTRSLLEAATLVRSEDDLALALERVAEVVGESLGFGVVVTNLYRREWDDFVVTTVYGDEDVREHLLGCTYERGFFEPILVDRFNCRGAFVVRQGTYDWNAEAGERFVPDLESPLDDDAWHPEDEVFVPFRGSQGELLGIFCVGMPLSGRRPTPPELETLVAVVSHAAIAVEAAQAAVASTRQRRALEHLLRVSGTLTNVSADEPPVQLVADAIHDALGFLKVAVYIAAGDDQLVPRATAGWPADAAPVQRSFPVDAFDRFTVPKFEVEGCYLVSSDAAERTVASTRIYTSEMNGSGPHAWQNHSLLVPLHGRDNRLIGIIWADDPADRLKPTRETLQALRMFANQAATAIEAASDVAALREITALRANLLEEKERLLARVVEVAELERMRVALDLHDGPIQKLTAVALRIDLLGGQLRRGDLEAARSSATEARDELAAEMDSLRKVMSNLRPPVLDERGVTPALRDCAEQVFDGAEIRIRIDSDVEGRLAPELETVLYRVTREALFNVRKHANAGEVTIRLVRDGDRLALSIHDDGTGFDSSALGESPAGHLGLTGIQELAGSLGGEMTVTNMPGGGTTIAVHVPYLGSAKALALSRR
jgi:signal transduction histidine kinase